MFVPNTNQSYRELSGNSNGWNRLMAQMGVIS